MLSNGRLTGIHDANHHRGSEQDGLGRQEDALCPTDRGVRETTNAPWQPMLQSDQKRTFICSAWKEF